MKSTLTVDMKNDMTEIFTKFVDENFKHTIKVVSVKLNEHWIENDGTNMTVTIKACSHVNGNPFIFFSLGQAWMNYKIRKLNLVY